MRRSLLLLHLLLFVLIRAEEDEEVLVVSPDPESQRQPYFQVSGFTEAGTSQGLPGGQKGALFGFSVAAFQFRDQGAAFLAGAPRQGGTGAVQRCDYRANPGGSPSFSCQRLPFVGSGAPNSSADQMFFGGAVAALSASGDGYMLSCGHLYKSVDGDTQKLLSPGLCNLQSSARGAKPVPVDPCGTGTKFSCLAGFSAALTAGKDGGILVGLGLPGMELGLGDAKVAAAKADLSNARNITYGYSHAKSTFQSFYTGYSVTFGKTLNMDALFVTTPLDYSQPRVPRVEYFTGLGSKGMLKKFGEFTDKAEHMGGFYGQSVATIRLAAGDDRSTLLVGEPFFSVLKEGLMDVGRVYLYCRLERKPVALRGPRPNSLFGFSLARLGDINGDGISDFAIGCPYCDEGHGEVFVFLGHPRCVLNQPVEVIRGREVARLLGIPPLQGFGWSLAGEADFDANSIPDLVIGSPLSDRVVLARARSVVRASCSIIGSCKVVGRRVVSKTCREYRRNRVGCHCRRSFRLNYDLNFPSGGELRGLKFRLLVDLDSGRNSSKRVFEVRGGKRSVINVTKELEAGQRQLTQFFRPVVSSDRFQLDMDTPMRVRATIEIATEDDTARDSKNRLVPMPRVVPEVGGELSCSAPIDVLYLACGNEVCKADLILNLLTEPTDEIVKRNGSTLVRRRVDFPVKQQAIKMYFRNDPSAADAIRPGLELRFQNGLRFTRVVSDTEGIPECNAKDETRAYCDYKEADNVNMPRLVEVLVDLSEAFQNPSPSKPVLFEAVTKTVSKDVSPENNEVRLEFVPTYRPTIKVASGESTQTVLDERNSSIYINDFQRIYIDQLGENIRHVYQLSNSGPSPANDLLVNISVPIASESGDLLLYIFEEIRAGVDQLQRTKVAPRVISESGQSIGTCTVPKEYLNQRHITALETHGHHVKTITDTGTNRTAAVAAPKRVRRSASPEKSAGTSEGRSRSSSRPKDFLECDRESRYFGRLQCVVIQCRIDQLPVNDAIRIIVDFWSWARTFVERRISDFEIKTVAKGVVLGVPKGLEARRQTLEFGPLAITTKYVFQNVKAPVIRQIPIWPIILGIILGILLLALIVILLYKCGFFKRRRPHKPPPPNYPILAVSPGVGAGKGEPDSPDNTPLIPKVKGPEPEPDKELDKEFDDMERSIRFSADEIELRKKAEDDAAVDRLVRQVSTHEPLANERPLSFPPASPILDASSPILIAVTPEEERKYGRKEENKKEEPKVEEKEEKEEEEKKEEEKETNEDKKDEEKETNEEKKDEEKEEDKKEEEKEEKEKGDEEKENEEKTEEKADEKEETSR